MKSKILAVVLLLAAPLAAEATPARPTLNTLISDPKYLNESMGANVILLTDQKTGQVNADLQKALRDAKLDAGRKFYTLPKGAQRPKATVQGPPEYPLSMSRNGISGKAVFLFFIGADGIVKSIYCYEASDRAFAVAGAAAIAGWRFTPAIVDKTPVPVLARQELEFDLEVH